MLTPSPAHSAQSQHKEAPSTGESSRTPAIEVQGLRKLYHQLIAIDDISFVMYRGEAFGFLGPNGAGKSTFVKILTSLVAPTAGSIRLLGQPLGHPETRRRIGYLPELPSFHRWLKAREFLEFHGHLYGMPRSLLKKRIGETLEMVGLAGRESQQLGTFSKGMLQRIGLAQALLNQPDLLVLDELVAGLDPVGQRDMRELLFELKNQGTSIFLNSHQLADVEAICDRIAIINQGHILKVGTPAELFGDEHLFEVRVNVVDEELLRQLSTIALSITRDNNDPGRLLLAVAHDEQAADIAEIIHAHGARLYTLAPHRRSLEQLFFDVIDSLRQTQ